jgi:hypothetical protein
LVPSGPDKHLYVVLTEPDNDGMHVLVNISSIDPEISYDATCVLKAGEHKFVKHESYAAYDFAIERHGNHVDDRAAKGIWIKQEDASEELVAKICNGIKKSPRTKRGIKDAFDRCVRHAEARKKK